MMEKLSVVIITLNEARNIRRCIESVHGLASEVVVVDSKSTDGTQQLATALGARVVEQSFLGHIEQKNFAISQAKGPWILSLDADEAVGQTLYGSIAKALESPTASGYSMNRLTNYCGKWIRYGGWYPDTKLRLFRKGHGAWQGTNPHDKYEMPKGEKVQHLGGDLLHYSFYTLDEHMKQIESFTTIAANSKFQQGVRSDLFKLWIKPIAKFVKGYIIKLGFLDGAAGLTIARRSAKATYMRYNKLMNLQNSNR